jgi:DNA-binding XRE family transcriptional regulator
MDIEFIVQDGRERVVLDRSDYDDLIDSLDAAIAMREIAAGAPTIPAAEMDAYLAAPTPLAFWRQRAGKTQAGLAEEVGVSQPFLAQIEGGRRQGTVRVLARLAKAVGVRIEDLLP